MVRLGATNRVKTEVGANVLLCSVNLTWLAGGRGTPSVTQTGRWWTAWKTTAHPRLPKHADNTHTQVEE